MKPGLNYDKHDPKFILLGKVFKFIENEKIKDVFNRYGVKNRNQFLIYLKIFFIHIFFNYNISEVVSELNRSSNLRNFAGILEVPSESQVYEYLSWYDPETYSNIVNSILRKFFRPLKTRKNTYIRKIGQYPSHIEKNNCKYTDLKNFILMQRLNHIFY